MKEHQRASIFAIAAHEAVGQIRKYTGEPYWYHCRDVANMVYQYGGSIHMISAAWLHDTVEDTKVTFDVLSQHFSPRTVQLVEELTDVSRPEDGNREERKALDRYHLSQASKHGQIIKVFDLMHNTPSIKEHAPDFWAVYKAEKILLLDALTKVDPELIQRARDLIDE